MCFTWTVQVCFFILFNLRGLPLLYLTVSNMFDWFVFCFFSSIWLISECIKLILFWFGCVVLIWLGGFYLVISFDWRSSAQDSCFCLFRFRLNCFRATSTMGWLYSICFCSFDFIFVCFLSCHGLFFSILFVWNSSTYKFGVPSMFCSIYFLSCFAWRHFLIFYYYYYFLPLSFPHHADRHSRELWVPWTACWAKEWTSFGPPSSRRRLQLMFESVECVVIFNQKNERLSAHHHRGRRLQLMFVDVWECWVRCI